MMIKTKPFDWYTERAGVNTGYQSVSILPRLAINYHNEFRNESAFLQLDLQVLNSEHRVLSERELCYLSFKYWIPKMCVNTYE